MNIDFITRLRHILSHYALSPSLFADQIGVPRSSMSHLLSGRNKPSLDFVLKIIDKFPDVDLYWLLKGRGSFPSKMESNPSSPLTGDLSSIKSSVMDTKKIDRVIVFYEDGTFESYNPSK
ncbi:helix-turn-helix transcriptional regulator [Croceitalea rosinachiae]|uniref:Helix-turn-helix transcriptional regulator n=1 Tax=Croceitalea rosinachiae TaxID=3075596 RepID=A0ABU3ABX2_9FLAO|nr:helix-turn-helix transcriptional regulator [Croceitalea sp. F388]MDT0607469.1 helix-turn-helix transcriptional regulator [Croceitalea sp. F388]